MRAIRWLIPVLTATALAGGCAARPDLAPDLAAVLADGPYEQARVRPDPKAVFALTPAMQDFAESTLGPAVRAKGREGLIDALYSSQLLRLSYDARTRNAAEAFEGKAGNCLSLVIMTSAFAKALGIEVRYQRLRAEDVWFRDGDLVQLIGHVNISLGQSAAPAMRASYSPGWLTVDFLPLDDAQRARVRAIDERRIVAMYFNNRAAEALADAQTARAYWWAKAGVEHDDEFASAYITLAVVHFRSAQVGLAERALRLALRLEPDNPQALHNLAATLRREGRFEEALATERRLSAVQPRTPIGLYKIGLVAYQRGDYASAKASFEEALRSAPEDQEFHFMLGLAYWRLGQRDQALEQVERARSLARDARQARAFSAKLGKLAKASSGVRP